MVTVIISTYQVSIFKHIPLPRQRANIIICENILLHFHTLSLFFFYLSLFLGDGKFLNIP